MKVKRQILSLLLTFSMLIGLMPVGSVPVIAQDESAAPALSADGYYEIYTAGQLYWFAEQVNGGNGDINARLMDNIVINENVLTADGELNGDGSGFRAWTPIGSNLYKGTFDGSNKTISGIYVNNGSSNEQGLFGCNYGTIQNVGVIDSYIKGDYYVGGVCGENDGTISNCYNTGTVSGNDDVGGVCGRNSGSTISNCYNTGAVSGNEDVGGVCGYNPANATISNCYNTGSVSGNDDVGGVCGYNPDSTISNCYNTGSVSGNDDVGGVCGENDGTISNCYNTGTVSGNDDVGGVCGRNSGSTISNCYNTGAVSGNDDVGGVCGFNPGDSTISNCYNTGTVSGNDDVGGVCGFNLDGSTISNCYNTGAVSGNDDYVGGVCGYNTASSTISNCYNTGSVSGNEDVGGVCGYNPGSAISCYYLDTSASTGIGTGSGEAVSKTAEQFASGEVCWLLNNQGENGAWRQTLGESGDDSPVLDGSHKQVYQINLYDCPNDTEGETAYSNSDDDVRSETHVFGEWNEEVPSDCINTGTKGYKDCTVCGKHFDENGSELTDLTIPVNSDNHSHTEEKDEIPATCESAGYTAGVYCTDCSTWVSGHEEITATGHSYVHHEEVTAECEKSGVAEHYTCENCDLIFDKDKNETTAEELVISSTGHSYEAEWKTDADKHWYECSCGAISEEAEHTFEWITDKEAEIGVAGSKHEECTVCGYAKEAVEIPALEAPDDSSATDSTGDDSSTVDDSSAVDSESSQADDSTSSSSSGDKSPNTGDSRSALLFMIALVSGTALAGTVAYSKKRGNQGR